MKKLLTLIAVFVLILSVGIVSASAYTLPEGMCITLDENRDLSDYKGDDVFGYMGDADVNGKINIRDATLIQKSAANLAEISDEGLKIADADLSGKINVRDATAIQKKLPYFVTLAAQYRLSIWINSSAGGSTPLGAMMLHTAFAWGSAVRIASSAAYRISLRTCWGVL